MARPIAAATIKSNSCSYPFAPARAGAKVPTKIF